MGHTSLCLTPRRHHIGVSCLQHHQYLLLPLQFSSNFNTPDLKCRNGSLFHFTYQPKHTPYSVSSLRFQNISNMVMNQIIPYMPTYNNNTVIECYISFSQSSQATWISPQMILRLPRNQPVNKPPSEDDRKPHWGASKWKPIHNHSDRTKGSIICFPCPQKFMSDGLAIGAYPLPDSILPPVHRGRAEARTAARFSFSLFAIYMSIFYKMHFCCSYNNESRKREKRGWSRLSFPAQCLVWLQSVSLNLRNTSVTQKALHSTQTQPPSPSTVKYWLSDNGPLVECIYYASVVDNPPKWASKRWLVDVFSNFLSSPCLPHHHHHHHPSIYGPRNPAVFQINNTGHVAHAQ